MNHVEILPANHKNEIELLDVEFNNQTNILNYWSQEPKLIIQEYHTLEMKNGTTPIRHFSYKWFSLTRHWGNFGERKYWERERKE